MTQPASLAAALLLAASLIFPQPAESQGVDWELLYTGEVWRNARGGLERGSAYLDNLDVSFSRQLSRENKLGLPAGELFGYFIYNNSEQLSAPLVGDYQVVSNIDNTAMSRVYELWYEFSLHEAHSFKLGLIDLNAEFDVIEPALLFLNSSHGIGPEYSQSGENGPSIFPATSVGVRYLWSPGENWSFRLAAFDAVPGDGSPSRGSGIRVSRSEGALLAAELNYASDARRYGVGTWFYTEDTKVYDRERNGKNGGLYGFIEHDDEEFGLASPSWWLRAGRARPSVNAGEFYVGAGLVFRPRINNGNNEWGLAVAMISSSDAFQQSLPPAQRGRIESLETAIELTYSYAVTRQLTLQPDVQFVVDPGFSAGSDDSLIFGLRLLWHRSRA